MLYEGKPLSLSWRSPGSILPWAGLDEEFLVVCGGCKLIWTLGMVSLPAITCRGEMDPPKGKEGSGLAREEGIRKGKVWENDEQQQKKMMEVRLEHCRWLLSQGSVLSPIFPRAQVLQAQIPPGFYGHVLQ